jgi:peptidoglycan/xylan/chitin deacetylase (PgdA/CDA1 family)
MPKTITNITYHNVSPEDRGIHPLLTVSPAQFATQMDWLERHHYSPIHPSEWSAWLTEKRPLPKKPILITFDDGYENLVKYAFPIVRRHRFKVAAYIVTGLVGKTNEWDRREGWSELRLMSREQIIEWADKDVEFGAHTRDHVDLRELAESELEEQVFGSKSDLEDIIGVAPTSFVYPYGGFNRQVRDCAARAFKTSMTTEEALCTDAGDPFLMPRIWVRPDENIARFAQRVKFAAVLTLRQRVISRKRLRRAKVLLSEWLGAGDTRHGWS